jgi:hypothetical protein
VEDGSDNFFGFFGAYFHHSQHVLVSWSVCEGIVSKRKDSRYRSGRSHHWVKCKNPAAPAVKREAEEDWGP